MNEETSNWYRVIDWRTKDVVNVYQTRREAEFFISTKENADPQNAHHFFIEMGKQ